MFYNYNMLANGSELVGRDPHYQAASLDQRRQEIEKRIDNLEGRIAGAVQNSLFRESTTSSKQSVGNLHNKSDPSPISSPFQINSESKDSMPDRLLMK